MTQSLMLGFGAITVDPQIGHTLTLSGPEAFVTLEENPQAFLGHLRGLTGKASEAVPEEVEDMSFQVPLHERSEPSEVTMGTYFTSFRNTDDPYRQLWLGHSELRRSEGKVYPSGLHRFFNIVTDIYKQTSVNIESELVEGQTLLGVSQRIYVDEPKMHGFNSYMTVSAQIGDKAALSGLISPVPKPQFKFVDPLDFGCVADVIQLGGILLAKAFDKLGGGFEITIGNHHNRPSYLLGLMDGKAQLSDLEGNTVPPEQVTNIKEAIHLNSRKQISLIIGLETAIPLLRLSLEQNELSSDVSLLIEEHRPGKVSSRPNPAMLWVWEQVTDYLDKKREAFNALDHKTQAAMIARYNIAYGGKLVSVPTAHGFAMSRQKPEGTLH